MQHHSCKYFMIHNTLEYQQSSSWPSFCRADSKLIRLNFRAQPAAQSDMRTDAKYATHSETVRTSSGPGLSPSFSSSGMTPSNTKASGERTRSPKQSNSRRTRRPSSPSNNSGDTIFRSRDSSKVAGKFRTASGKNLGRKLPYQRKPPKPPKKTYQNKVANPLKNYK